MPDTLLFSDVLFTVGLLLGVGSLSLGMWTAGRWYGQEEGYDDGFRDAARKAEELVRMRDDLGPCASGVHVERRRVPS